MRGPSGSRRCLVCDELIPKRSKHRSVFERRSDMDDVDYDLSERLQLILDSKLNLDQIHSTEICHLCETKAIQIEEYFRLLLMFRESFKKTVKKYNQMATCSKKGTQSGRKNAALKRQTQVGRQVTGIQTINTEAEEKPDRTSVAKKEVHVFSGIVQAAKTEEMSGFAASKAVGVEFEDDSAVSAEPGCAVQLKCLSDEESSYTLDEITVNVSDVGISADHFQIKAGHEDGVHIDTIPVEKSDSSKGLLDSVIVFDTSDIPQTQNCTSITNAIASATTSSIATNTVTATTATGTPATTSVVPVTKRFAGKRKYKCIVCSKVFANMRNLKRHQVKHSEDHTATKHQCPACKQCFTQSNSLLSHAKLHKAEGMDIFPCGQCSQLFLRDADLRTHKERRCVRSKKHKCAQCHLRFRCASERANHELTHIGTKPFKCYICEKAFSRKQILKEHSRLHSGERPYRCSQCSAAFRFRSGLNFHTNKVHGESRSHSCTLCNKTFAVLANLHSHLRIHTGEKQFLCPECGHGFAQSGTLQLHLATHTKEHPYKCQSCDKSFKRKDTLQRHSLTHSGDQPYKCSECTKMYRHQRSLNTHMLTHSGKKPHACGTCGKGFTRKVALQEHARLHTGEKSHHCERCGKEFALRRYLKKHLQVHVHDPVILVDEVNTERLPEEAEVMASEMEVGEVVVTAVTEGTAQLMSISLSEESITPGSTAEPSLLPLDLHQPYTTNNNFQPEPHLTEHILSEFNKPLPASFPASPVLQPKLPTAQTSHELIYVCANQQEMPSAMNRVNDTSRVVSYTYAIPQPKHPETPLLPMSDAFNETLNLKIEKYADYVTRELCMAAPPGNFACNSDEAVYSSMTLVQTPDQLASGLVSGVSLYPPQNPTHIQEHEYH